MNNSNDADPLSALLASAAQGDEAAFARLYSLTSPKLYGLLLRILKTPEWAEDALQDCYLRIWHKAEQYTSERGSPMGWLATIARYRALDLLRARRPQLGDVQLQADDDGPAVELADTSQSPEDHAVQSEGMDRLDDCMKALPTEQRNVVLMAYYEGFTQSEIAQRRSLPLGTIKTWLHRGLAKLRDCMGGA